MELEIKILIQDKLNLKYQINDMTQLSTHYKDEEEREKVEFEIEQKRRQREFLERQRKRRHEYQTRLNELERKNIDAIKLFELPQNYTVEQLKEVLYKKLNIKTHPDRPTGNKQKFQLVTKCYLSLLEKYKLRQSDKTYNDLREGSKQYIKQQNTSSPNVSITGNNEVLDKKILMLSYLINYMNNINYGTQMMKVIKIGFHQQKMNLNRLLYLVKNSIWMYSITLLVR